MEAETPDRATEDHMVNLLILSITYSQLKSFPQCKNNVIDFFTSSNT